MHTFRGRTAPFLNVTFADDIFAVTAATVFTLRRRTHDLAAPRPGAAPWLPKRTNPQSRDHCAPLPCQDGSVRCVLFFFVAQLELM